MASIIFNILGIALYAAIWIINGKNPQMSWIWIIFLPLIAVCVASIIVCLVGTPKSTGFIIQGVIDLIFGSLLGGIFMLCIPEERVNLPRPQNRYPRNDEWHDYHEE